MGVNLITFENSEVPFRFFKLNMKYFTFFNIAVVVNGFDLKLASNQLCDWNYEACIHGDKSMGADCLMNPEVGASLLCTDQCSEHFQVLGGEKLLNYESFCSF